ncbi:hypothetical protein CWE08_06545 [Aliidiomarina iranensis]|uniref:PDZ domain-containing protein n=1 Tax=Aliidiomarina iranensis TaxID=1434071 RepID=A0A432VX67_9GAMM|nr:S41 family peptidase [Aliidiomarina iranensis]RUO21236.1 hypothetical protein CWE08_06545 [Aliidiomarina iranensis]
MCASKVNSKRFSSQRKLLVAATLPLVLAACGSEDVFEGEPPLINNNQCSIAGQNQQLLDFMDDRYLWNDEINTNVNPDSYGSVFELLDDLVVPRDRFSFIITEEEYQARYIDAEFFGFGFGIRDRTDLGVIEVRYVYDNSAAAQAGIRRGDVITEIEGIPMETWYQRIENGEASTVDLFGDNSDGVEREITYRKPDGQLFTERLEKSTVETNTVMATERLQIDDKEVGYFVFDTFINRAEVDLNNAYDALIGVDELIIDLRYNGGGLVRVANQLASQAAWNNVENEVFLTYQYNDNYEDQVTFFDLGPGIERLNLDRVYVLTTNASCSSSELVINSLSPFVEVVTIGAPTCGKPVGQQPRDICDKVVFAITFQTVNAEGFGNYFDGLPVTCAAEDVIVGDWGDPADPLLAEASYHIANGQCSAAASVSSLQVEETDARVLSAPVKSNNPLLEKWRNEF